MSSSSESLHTIEEVEGDIDFFEYRDPSFYTGIMKDVLLNNKDEVLHKISLGKSLRVIDNNGDSLLHIAVYAARDDMSMIDLLLQHEEIDINAENFKMETPLLHSIAQKKDSVAIHLIRAGAKVNSPADFKPLHICLKSGTSEICEALIKAGADINAPDLDGDTPLHLAVHYCQFEMMCMLLCYGAEMRPNALFRPFTFSLYVEKFAYSDILIDYETEFDSASLEYALIKNYPNIEYLISKIVEEEKNFCFAPGMNNPLPRLLSNVDIFEFVWKNFRFECDFSNFFKELFLHQSLNKKNFLEIMDILKTSRQEVMMKMTESSSRSTFLFPLIMRLKDLVSADYIYEICVIFLSYGVVVWDIDLDVVYDKFGYCKLFQFLLQMDIKPSFLPKVNVVPYLHYSIDDRKCFRDRVIEVMIIMEGKPNHSYDYEILTSLTTLPYIEKFKHLNLSRKVPKLLELARNKLRDHLCVKYKIKNSRQFYTLLKVLPFHNLVKQLISLQIPVNEQSVLNDRFWGISDSFEMLVYYDY